MKSDAVIGMGPIISDYAVVGEWAVGGEGAVVRQSFEVPNRAIAVGVPVKVVSEIKDHQRRACQIQRIFQDLALRYPKGLKKLRD